MTKEIKNKNLVARITESHNKFNVTIVQIVNNGIEIGEDYFHSKLNFSTFNRAEKWALKQIA